MEHARRRHGQGMAPGSRHRLQITSALLLLDEARHRHANELACALASLQLAKAGIREPGPLIDKAIARIEAQAALERLLLDPGTEQLAYVLFRLLDLIRSARGCENGIHLKAATTRIRQHATMRSILTLTYELTINAMRAAGPGGLVEVLVRRRPGGMDLVVRNRIAETDTPSDALSDGQSGRGHGRFIAQGIVEGLDGTLMWRRRNALQVALARIPLPTSKPEPY